MFWTPSPLDGSVSYWSLVLTLHVLCTLLFSTSYWVYVLIYPPVSIGLTFFPWRFTLINTTLQKPVRCLESVNL